MAALRVVVALLLLIAGPFAHQAPPAVSDKITLLTFSNARHIDRDQLASGFWVLVREQNLQSEKLPYIIVIQVPESAAVRFGMLSTSPVLVDHWQAATSAYYQVWVVGEPKLADCLLKLQAVLQHEFRLQQTDEAAQALANRAASLIGASSGERMIESPGGHGGRQ